MTLDTPTMSRLSELYPDFAHKMINVYEAMFQKHSLVMRCTEAYRSFEKQDEFYDQGRTKPGKIITDKRGGDGLHNYGLACDSCFLGNDPYLERDPNKSKFLWNEFGLFCKMEGLRWVGVFKSLQDLDHAEISYGFGIQDFRNMYCDGGLPNVWQEIDQRCKVIQLPT